MIRKATIVKRIKEIHALDNRSLRMEGESEAKYGYVISWDQAQIDKLNDKRDKLVAALVARLHKDGLSGKDGLTSEESGNDIWGSVEGHWVIGDGSWC